MILFKHSSIFLLGGILSLIVAMGIGRFAYTPILPLMQSDLSFSNAVGGYLATSNYAGYLLGAFLVGVIPVKQHRTFILRLSLVVSILTTASMGLFQSYFIWYGLRFISGISSAIVFVMASGIVLDKLAIRNKLNWSGIFYGGVGLGIFLSSLLIPILNRLYSWEGVWLGLSGVSMLLVLIVWISMKDEPLSFEKTSKQESALCVPPLKWIPWLIVAYGLEGLGYIVTGTFIVSIAKEIPSFNGDATVVWMVVGLAAIPSCIIWSELAKKIGFVKSLVLAMTLQAFGIALPALWVSQIGVVLSALLFGATFMGITTLATTLARQMSPFNSSRIIGILTSIYAGGQMIGPSIAGIISTATQNYDAVLLGASSVVLVGAGLLLTGIRFEKSPEFLKKQI